MYEISNYEKFNTRVSDSEGCLTIMLTRQKEHDTLPNVYIAKRKIDDNVLLSKAVQVAVLPMGEVQFGMCGMEPNLEKIIDDVINQTKAKLLKEN